MSKLIKARSAQTVLSAEFKFNWDDTMELAGTGVETAFSTVAAHDVDVIPLPRGAVIISGEVVTITAFGGATAVNVKVGDATSDNRYLGTTDKVAAGRTALVPTGFISTGEAVRLTVTPTVAACTSGAAVVRVQYVMADRVSEVHIK